MNIQRSPIETTVYTAVYIISTIMSGINAYWASGENRVAWVAASAFALSAYAQFMRIPLRRDDSDNILDND